MGKVFWIQGKTHLALHAKKLLKKLLPHQTVQARKWGREVQRLRNGEWDLTTWLSDMVDVLILDDVGSENITPITINALNRIIDDRLNKWMILTTNLTPNDIADRIDCRIASRLFRGAHGKL